MRVLEMISDTSHDGIDVAIVDFELVEGRFHGIVRETTSTSYSPSPRRRLIDALPPAPTTLAEMCEIDTLIGQEFAKAATEAASRVESIDLVCSHGQTVFHWVRDGRALGTLQLGQPAWIANEVGVPVVANVRIRDIVQSGQGAPLVSLMDTLLLAGIPGRSAALNLGGISNVTIVAEGAGPIAYDIGPANALIDAVVVATGADESGFDRGGALGAAGQIDERLLATLLDEPY